MVIRKSPFTGTRKSNPGKPPEQPFAVFRRSPVGIELKNAAWFILSLRCALRIVLPADPAGVRPMRLNLRTPFAVNKLLLLCGGKWTNCAASPGIRRDLAKTVAESSHFLTGDQAKRNPA